MREEQETYLPQFFVHWLSKRNSHRFFKYSPNVGRTSLTLSSIYGHKLHMWSNIWPGVVYLPRLQYVIRPVMDYISQYPKFSGDEAEGEVTGELINNWVNFFQSLFNVDINFLLLQIYTITVMLHPQTNWNVYTQIRANVTTKILKIFKDFQAIESNKWN